MLLKANWNPNHNFGCWVLIESGYLNIPNSELFHASEIHIFRATKSKPKSQFWPLILLENPDFTIPNSEFLFASEIHIFRATKLKAKSHKFRFLGQLLNWFFRTLPCFCNSNLQNNQMETLITILVCWFCFLKTLISIPKSELSKIHNFSSNPNHNFGCWVLREHIAIYPTQNSPKFITSEQPNWKP